MAALRKTLSIRSNFIRVLYKPSNVAPVLASNPCEVQQKRGLPTSRHWNPKFKELRRAKVLKVDLPKFVELKQDRDKPNDERTPDEIRIDMKKNGRVAPRAHTVLPLNISCTRGYMEEYKPEEGDGRQSDILTSGISDPFSKLNQKRKDIQHLRKLKKYEDFNEAEFAVEAQDIILETHHLLQDVYKNQDRLHELVTEHAFPEMVHGLEKKTFRWTFVESVEAPKVVQIKVQNMITDDNMFAQVTVRLHTKQILAIYDRFGRLMFGDPQVPKSVVDFYILEKWISDTYGQWRIHGKIVPSDAPPRGTLLRTYKDQTPAPVKNEESQIEESISEGAQPAMA